MWYVSYQRKVAVTCSQNSWFTFLKKLCLMLRWIQVFVWSSSIPYCSKGGWYKVSDGVCHFHIFVVLFPAFADWSVFIIGIIPAAEGTGWCVGYWLVGFSFNRNRWSVTINTVSCCCADSMIHKRDCLNFAQDVINMIFCDNWYASYMFVCLGTC